MSDEPIYTGKNNTECDMKTELKHSSNRHSERLLADLGEIMDIPKIAVDRIRREVEYATMDGYRITMKSRNGDTENEKETNGNI
jgi:hypothetical protein|tara:strand:+ start:27 stop:278 length:252 start_codon:yes stop_codon:yes gene_type:complete